MEVMQRVRTHVAKPFHGLHPWTHVFTDEGQINVRRRKGAKTRQTQRVDLRSCFCSTGLCFDWWTLIDRPFHFSFFRIHPVHLTRSFIFPFVRKSIYNRVSRRSRIDVAYAITYRRECRWLGIRNKAVNYGCRLPFQVFPTTSTRNPPR